MCVINKNNLLVICFFIISLFEIYYVNCADSSNDEHYIDDGYYVDNSNNEVRIR